MFRFIIAFSFALASLLYFSSCSDDNSTNNPVSLNLFPLKVGHIWFYESFDIDKNKVTKPETLTNDTVKITGQKTVLDKLAFVFLSSSSDGTSEENYFYSDGQKYYVHSDYLVPDLSDLGYEFPIDIPAQWALLADNNGSQWEIVTLQIPDTEIDSPLGKAKIKGTLSIKGEKGTKSNMTVKGQSIESQEFKIVYVFDGTLTLDITPIPANFDFSITDRHYFADKIGLVKRQLDPVSISIISLTQDIDGNVQSLTDYIFN